MALKKTVNLKQQRDFTDEQTAHTNTNTYKVSQRRPVLLEPCGVLGAFPLSSLTKERLEIC